MRIKEKIIYNLAYHLNKTDNPRLRAKIKKMVEIFPEKYNCQVSYTKRLVWFHKNNKRFIHIRAEKKYLFLKIKTPKCWLTTRLPDWEDFRRIYWILKNKNIS